MCGILTLDSIAFWLQLQNATKDNDFITLKCLRILPYDIPDGKDIFSQNLRDRGITDKQEIEKRGKLTEQFEATTSNIADATVCITGEQEADVRHIKDAVRALCGIQIEDDEQ